MSKQDHADDKIAMPDGNEYSRRDVLAAIGAATVTGGITGTAISADDAESAASSEVEQSLGGAPQGDLSNLFEGLPIVGPSNLSPSNPSDGKLWLRTDTGERVYYDEDTDSWVDPGLSVNTIESDSVSADQISGGVSGGIAVSRLFGKRIEHQSLSGASAAEFTDGINSDHSTYFLSFADVIPSTDGGQLTVQVSTDGGSSWESGASAYHWGVSSVDDAGNTSGSGSDADSKIQITRGGVGNGARRNSAGCLRISNPASADLVTLVSGYTSAVNDLGVFRQMTAGGSHDAEESVNGIRLLFDNGGISGEVTLHGVII